MSALLTLRVQISRLTGKVNNELAPDVILFLVTRLESKSKTVEEVRTDAKVLDYIQQCIDSANIKAVSRV